VRRLGARCQIFWYRAVRSNDFKLTLFLYCFITVLQTHTNLGLGTIPENACVSGAAAYRSDKPKAIDVDDVSVAISRLGFGDSDDSVFGGASSVGFKSAYQQAVEKGEKVKKVKTLRGNTECGLPYIVDVWRDCNGRVRISIQLWLLSGDDFHAKLLARVSSGAKEFVIAFPMDPYMERSDLAFSSFIMEESVLSQFQRHALLYVIKNHPKSIARIQSVSMIKQRQQAVDGRYYEQRIPLPRKVMHKFATALDGDSFFNGLKFVKHSNGAVHMYAELLGEMKDNYTPEERKQAPVTKVAKPLKVDVPVAMDVCSTSGGPPAASHDVVVLNDFQTDNGSRGRSVKRRSTGENGTPVGSPHSVQSPSSILRAINQFDAAQLQALQQAMTLANQQALANQQQAHANAHANAHAQAQAQAHAQQQAQAIAQQQAALQAQQQALAQQQSQAQAQA